LADHPHPQQKRLQTQKKFTNIPQAMIRRLTTVFVFLDSTEKVLIHTKFCIE